MVSDNKLANAMGGKTARACDSCIRKRARWYCAADDAFLCQSCDGSVHSANPLARRHERVRLKTTSFKHSQHEENSILPSWHHGFTRKARTPRLGKQAIHKREAKSEESVRNPVQNLVPEIGSDEHEENEEEQVMYRVPIFDPFGPSDTDLAEFAADVENLLGTGFEEESFDMEGLGILDCREKMVEGPSSSGRVKVEENEDGEVEGEMVNKVDNEIDLTREMFELNFDYDSPLTWEDDKVGGGCMVKESEEFEVGDVEKKKVLLKLNYEGVIATWADQRCPWTTGDRPEFDANDCWTDCAGVCGTVQYPYGDMGITSGHTAMLDGGREARVSRYREKRRTRLFSKKIRYEVRKLNAEKRPRMKGRFVKRANFAGPPFALLTK